jgi:hypothetical protein
MIKMLWVWSLVKCEFVDTDFSFGLFCRPSLLFGDGGQTGYLFGGLIRLFYSKHRLE